MKRIFLLILLLMTFLPLAQVSAQQPDFSLPDLFDHVAQSVVYIEVISREPSVFGDNIPLQAVGSGFVLDAEGHIVTNHHVAGDAERIQVTFYDGTFARAELIGDDPDSDLAVIKVEVDPAILRPVVLGDSGSLRVGETVVALGNPYQQSWTMTTGIVSALGRTNQTGNGGYSIAQMIQTDAAMNPGNSGGPLFNLRGEVVGVNTMIFTETESNSGIGFSVPSNTVSRVVPELITNGIYRYTWLGIQGDDLRLDEIELMGLEPNTRGVLISFVRANSPASRAGLQGNDRTDDINGVAYDIGGDVITAINGTPVRGMAALINYLAENTRPGDQVELTVVRDGGIITLTTTLDARPSGQ